MLSRILSFLVYLYAACFIFGRLGEILPLFKEDSAAQVVLLLLFMNVILPQIIRLPIPSKAVQLVAGMALLYYYADVHTAHLSDVEVDLTGKVAIVTGGNSGIGYAVASALAARNATVIIGCRNTAKGATAAENMLAEIKRDAKYGNSVGTVEAMRLDLSDLAIVDYFSLMVSRRHPRIDILVNNAGYNKGRLLPERPTAQGIERHLGTMHMGHFALTEFVIRRNRDGAKGLSVANVASGTHHICALTTLAHSLTGAGSRDACLPESLLKQGFKDGGFRSYAAFTHLFGGRFSGDLRYVRAKLANVLHAWELPSRHKGVFATSADLGFVSSNITAMHSLLSNKIRDDLPTLDQLFMRKAAPHGIRAVLLGATYPFAKAWARKAGFKPTSGAVIDPIGKPSRPFKLEKQLGLDGYGGRKPLARKLYDTSLRILQEYEEKRGGAMDEFVEDGEEVDG